MATSMLTQILAALVCAHAASAMVAPRSRGGFTKANIKSFSLQSWGPMEKDTSGDAVFLDPTINSESTIKGLVNQGKEVVCYMSAGTVESFRSDKGAIDKTDALAKKYKGWGGTETWLDITQWQSLKGVMSDRIQEAASKGCTALEIDNCDCFVNMCVSGASYDELKSKEIEYVKWLMSEVHGHGMAVGLKNAIGILDSVGDGADFAINEQCQEYNECSAYKSFAAQGKLVFNVEYNSNGGKACSDADQFHMLTKYEGGGWHNCF